MSLTNTHGSARLVPGATEVAAWGSFAAWLGNAAHERAENGDLILSTAAGRLTAHPGDWIVRTLDSALHVVREARA